VTSELQGLGSIDFGPSTEGVQSAISYQGGLGFDMGEMEIPTTLSGKPDVDGFAASATLAGGFTLAADSSLALDDLAPPTDVTSLLFGRDLTVVDPASILYG